MEGNKLEKPSPITSISTIASCQTIFLTQQDTIHVDSSCAWHVSLSSLSFYELVCQYIVPHVLQSQL